MSFKSWSSAQSAPGKNNAADKPKAVPATGQPVAQPDKALAEVSPAAKLPLVEPTATDQAVKVSETPKS